MRPYYSDSLVTIYNADCRDVLADVRASLVLTDPPYAHDHVDGGGFAQAREFYAGGALTGLQSFRLADYAAALLAAAPMLVAFHSRDLIRDYAVMAADAGRRYDLHVWHKTNAIPFTANTWKSDVEYIALVWAKKPGWRQLHQAMHSKVYTSGICRDPAHPAAKPIPLLAKYLAVLAPASVVDPFAGSGTTLRAAKDAGIRAVGIEWNERYCEVAAERCRQEVLTLEVAPPGQVPLAI